MIEARGISVIIPAFNAERYLAAAIDSVFDQTLQPDEVIVVNDGSTDLTAAVLAGYGDRINVIAQPNGGIAVANNRGVAAANGSFLCFLDADDLWVADKLEKQMDWMTRHPETEAVFGHVRQFVSEDLNENDRSRFLCPLDAQAGVMKITMLIRRTAFGRVGTFDEGLRNADFVDWYARALDHGLRTHMLPEVVALRRQHNANLGVVARDAQRRDNVAVLKRALDRRRAARRDSRDPKS
jgi:glycosyltransferase involved in cell wall biosynthesis